MTLRLVAAAAVVLAAAACSRPQRDPYSTTQPTYDKTTGKLTQLTYDRDHDGKIDTWTEMNGAKPVRSRIDSNEDGKIDRWEYYDDKGQLLKVGLSRNDDGKPDAWAYSGPDGKVARVEISSSGDEHKIDRWETYENGELKTVAFDEQGKGYPTRRLTYAAGNLVLIETDPDGSGGFRARTPVK